MAQRSVSHLNLAAIHNQNCRVGEELLALDDEAAVHRDRGEAVGGDCAAQCVRILESQASTLMVWLQLTAKSC